MGRGLPLVSHRMDKQTKTWVWWRASSVGSSRLRESSSRTSSSTSLPPLLQKQQPQILAVLSISSHWSHSDIGHPLGISINYHHIIKIAPQLCKTSNFKLKNNNRSILELKRTLNEYEEADFPYHNCEYKALQNRETISFG